MIRTILLALLFSACDTNDVPPDLVRPIDDYCYEGLCASDQKCWKGECYDRCTTNDDCNEGCCAKGENSTTYYCAPAEVCE